MIVADTNIIAYLGLPSPYTEKASQLLSHDDHWVAPLLWRSEMRNVLALYLRQLLLKLSEALRIQLEAEIFLQGREYQVNSLDVMALVNQSHCSAYDCEFVALAKQFDTKLVTMDKKLTRAFPETAVLLTHYI